MQDSELKEQLTFRSWERCLPVKEAHSVEQNARLAALMAFSASSRAIFGTLPITWPLAGFTTGNVSPFAASTHCPSMKAFDCRRDDDIERSCCNHHRLLSRLTAGDRRNIFYSDFEFIQRICISPWLCGEEIAGST